MLDVTDLTLGQTDQALTLETSDDNRSAATALATQARRSLDIYTRELDKAIYDYQPFIDAVRELATGSRTSMIRILVKDSSRAVKQGHRLINLAQRITSFIEVRKPPEEYKEYNEAFLIADGIGVVHRKLGDRFEGKVCFNAPIETRNLLAFFNEAWEKSAPDTQLRRLYL